MTRIHERSLAIAVTTSSRPRYGPGLLSGKQSEMSSGSNGSTLCENTVEFWRVGSL